MVYVPRGELFLPDWAPAPGWSIGFSSRSGKNTDFHYIRAVQIELGALVDAASVPLHVSLNAQQYGSGGPEATVTYYAVEPRGEQAPYGHLSGPEHGW